MAKLYYFDGRGRGELIRLTLGAAGIPFTEEFARDRETFLKWKDEGKMLFHQLPVLEIDGKVLTQSNSIARYLGKKAGLAGENDDQAVLVDMYFEAGRDFTLPALRIIMADTEENVLKNAKENTLPKYMPIFNKILSDNGTGYMVGSNLTLADISVFEGLLTYVEYMGKEILEEYKSVQALYFTLVNDPKIKAFLEGPQRKRKNDDRYKAEVRASLGRS